MIKVFIPEIKGRVKTSVRGFWRNDSGKVFYDYLKIVNSFILNTYVLEDLRQKYNQEALFIIQNNIGYCYNFKNTLLNKIDVLNNRIYKEVLRANLKTEIKEALKVYGGVTIYKEGNKYFKEIFYK